MSQGAPALVLSALDIEVSSPSDPAGLVPFRVHAVNAAVSMRAAGEKQHGPDILGERTRRCSGLGLFEEVLALDDSRRLLELVFEEQMKS